jgi:hypothetical protein
MARNQKAPCDHDDGSLSRSSELIAIAHLLARQAAREWLLIAGIDDLRHPAREVRTGA